MKNLRTHDDNLQTEQTNKEEKLVVLCIDDDYLVRKGISTFLERCGFTVLQADDGKKGLDMFFEHSPDVVLVDIRMPNMNGLEVLDAIRKQAPEVPVIIISGAGVMNSAIEAIRMGAWDFITKPIYDPAILEHTVRREVERAHIILELKKYQEGLEEEIIRQTNELHKELKERRSAQEASKKSLNDLQKVMDGTIQAFGRVGEVKDPYTAGHQKRVSKLACAIARILKMSKEQVKGIDVAASLHDIGKIYIPSEILNKPGSLTSIERSLIETHPSIGHEILHAVPFPWPVAEVILQHHERLDGSGYPFGINGQDICMEAKIISVADVVEAMSTHRPYRQALGMEEALKEIKQGSDVLYDPNVVAICTRLIREEKFKFENS